MTLTPGRTARLVALAVATGTIVVAASSGAVAASKGPQTATPLSYAGDTGSSGLALALTLPLASALSAPLAGAPGLGGLINSDGTISLSLLNETGSLQHDGTGKSAPIATSQGVFAGGTLGTVLTNLSQPPNLVLNQTVISTLAHPNGTSAGVVGALASLSPPLSTLLDLKLPGITETSAAAPMSTDGTSVIAGLDLGNIGEALPAGTLTTLTAALTNAVTQLNSVIGPINAVLATLGGPVKGTPLAGLAAALTSLSGELSGLTTEINAAINSIASGSIVSLKTLTTTHSLQTVGDEEISTVSNKLAGLSILGGLVTLAGFSNSLTTEAGGTAGTAKVIAQPNLATATAGTNNELQIALGAVSSVQGTIADIVNDATGTLALSTALETLTSGLSTLTDTLNTALGVAGISIKQDAVLTDQSASNGSSATGSLTGLEIVVNPLNGLLPTGSSLPLATTDNAAAPAAATPPLLTLDIGALDASSAAAIVTPTVAATPTAPTAPVKRLAFTGADLPLTAGIASLLVLGGAYAARRRRRPGLGDDI
jgi:hypothetical protein